MDHLDEFSVLRLVDGEVDENRRVDLERHLSKCVSCLRRFEGLQAESLLIGSALWESEEPLPQPFRPRRELPWVAAGFLAAGAVGFATLWRRLLNPALTGLQTVGVDGGSFASDMVTREVVGDDSLSLGQIFTELVILIFIVGAVIGLAKGGFGSRRARLGKNVLLLCTLPTWLAILGSGATSTSHAAVIERNVSRYLLSEDQVIDNDLFVVSEDIRIEGVVRGDLIVFGRYVSIDGTIEGDVIGAAQIIEIGGSVLGNVRTGSQSLTVQGAVLKNVTSIGERLYFDDNARLEGSVIAAGREIELLAPIVRDLILAGPTLGVNNRVDGSILAWGESFEFGPESRIGGPVTFYGREEPDIDEDAILASSPVFEPTGTRETSSLADRVLSLALSWMAAMGFGAALLWLSPQGWRRVIDRIHRAGVDLLIGFLILVTIPLFVVLLGLSLVGLPLGLLSLAMYGFAIYSSQLFVGAWLGERLLGHAGSFGQALTRLALGLAMVYGARTLPVMGGVVTLVVILWGIGAIGTSIWVNRRRLVTS